MATEIWAHDAHLYSAQCVEAGLTNFTWSDLTVRRLDLDPQAHCLQAVPMPREFRAITVFTRDAIEVDRYHSFRSPKAVYPVWIYGYGALRDLEALMAENRAGAIRNARYMAGKHSMFWPRLDQEHRVIVTNLPSVSSSHGRKFRLLLQELQEEYPDCTLHLHGTGDSFQWNFGLSARAATIDFKNPKFEQRLVLGSGKFIVASEALTHAKWVRMLGFRSEDLKTRQGRMLFNIKSALWAAENWEESKEGQFGNFFEPLGDDDIVDILNGIRPKESAVISRHVNRTAAPMVGDKFYCDRCSYAANCRSFRVGSVCTVDGSNAKELMSFFQTRNSEKIMRGLVGLIEIDLERLELGRASEEESGKLDPNVSKLTSSLFNQGERLAKLIDPSLRPSGVSVHVNSGGATQVGVAAGSMPIQTLAANAIEELEAHGIPRTQITSELVERYLDAEGDPDQIKRLIIERQTKYALPEFTVDDPIDGELVEDDEL